MLGLQLRRQGRHQHPDARHRPVRQVHPRPGRGLPQYVTSDAAWSRATSPSPVPVPANVLHFDTPFLTDIAHNADPSAAGHRRRPGTPTGRADAGRRQHAVGRLRQPARRHLRRRDARTRTSPAVTVAATRTSRSARSTRSSTPSTTGWSTTSRACSTSDTSATGVAALAEWKLPTPETPGGWNGERLFQAARFVTEMEYQHLVFEEFARKVQPADPAVPRLLPGHQPGDRGRVRARGLPLRPLDARRHVARTNVDPATGAEDATTRCRC